jgi:hypothetical protein
MYECAKYIVRIQVRDAHFNKDKMERQLITMRRGKKVDYG